MNHNISVDSTTDRLYCKTEKIHSLIYWIIDQYSHQLALNVSIIFVNDDFIQHLNKQFLNKDEPTDVLSFKLSQEGNILEGEIYISSETAQQNALHYNVTHENELLRLVAHGIFHLLDYDDATAAEREKMTKMENKALESIDSAY